MGSMGNVGNISNVGSMGNVGSMHCKNKIFILMKKIFHVQLTILIFFKLKDNFIEMRKL